MEKMTNFDDKPKRVVVVMEDCFDSCNTFSLAIVYKKSIEFKKEATEIIVDGVTIYLAGRCSYILTEDKAIGYNRGYVEDKDFEYEFEETKDYYDNYVE